MNSNCQNELKNMKTILKRSMTVIAVLCITAFSVMKASAAPSDLLIQAYANLEMADHDYHGHRADAMKQIEAAGKELGVNIRGDGKGHEKQGVSDTQLQNAKGLLEQAKVGLKGKPLKHVNAAIHQINVAL